MNSTDSPWGLVQTATPLADGLSSVTTAGHGGLRLEPHAAERLGISEACLSRGLYENDIYWFEEDCDASLLLWEVPALWSTAFPHLYQDGQDDDQFRDQLRQSLSRWNPEYLLERGEPIDQAGYDFYLINREHSERMLAEDPDLIQYVTRHGAEVEVETADGTTCVVTQVSYERCRDERGFPLLSRCEIVPESCQR